MNINRQQTIKNLQQAIKKDDHNQVYEYSKILLKQSPQDQQYQQCLIISSLKINLIEDLEGVFKNNNNKQNIQKLYAYYLYTIGEYDKAIIYINNILKTLKNQKLSISYKLLLAQTFFKLNNPSQSANLMLQLLQKSSSNLDKQDLQMYLINLFATSINKQIDQGIVHRYKNILKEKQKYCKQIFYNYGLLLIELGQYKQGIQCLNIFERELKKGQDDNDIRMLKVVKDYIEYKEIKSNRNNITNENNLEKIKQYEKMQEQSTQINLKNVIKNNLIYFKYQNNEHLLENFHQILRIIDQALDKKSKMTKPQQFILKLNKFTLLLRKNRLQEAAKVLKDLQTNYESNIFLNNNISYLKDKYCLLKKNKDISQIFTFIKSLQKHHKNLGFCLLADLKKQENKQKQLISQIKQLNNHSPIIKNYIFSLLIKNPQLFQEYNEYLDELLEKTNDIKILDILLKLYQNKKDQIKQQIILNKILKRNNKDFDTKVKLAEIYLNDGKTQQAEDLLKGIQQPEEINDINYLQNIQKNIHISKIQDQVIVRNQAKDNKDKVKQKSNHVEKKRIKKKRKIRLPKNIEKYVQGFKSDPERWLPKWQRKGYKKKGKKGTGKTQGLATVSKEETKNVFTTNASTSAKQVTKDVQKKRK